MADPGVASQHNSSAESGEIPEDPVPQGPDEEQSVAVEIEPVSLLQASPHR